MKKVSSHFVYWVVAVQTVLLVALLFSRAQAVHAQSGTTPVKLFIEPGTQMLADPSGRQNVMGKVVIDLTTGNVWGFPTYSSASYPSAINVASLGAPNIPVSKPFLLAKFDLTPIAKYGIPQ